MLAIQSDWQSGVAHLVAKRSAHLEAVFQTQPIWRWSFSLGPFGGSVSDSGPLGGSVWLSQLVAG